MKAFIRPPTRAHLRPALALAIPASLAAMITPILGIVDTAVLARGAQTADVAGVALAGAVFSILYWSLGFLRMSLAGLTAQADGRGDEAAARAHLVQGVAIGAVIGLGLLIFRGPIAELSMAIMGSQGSDASPDALGAMETYINIRLLAAPFAIATYAALGYLTGQGRTGLMMVIVVTTTLLNAGLDVYFVMGLNLGTYGIALGTAIAESAAFGIGALIVLGVLHRRGGVRQHWSVAKMTSGLGKVLSLNADIFLRTFALAVVFFWFTRAGARFGDLTLAANQVLMHITLAAGLLLDGPAIAAESLVGKALGRPTDRKPAFMQAVHTTSYVAMVAAIALTGALVLFGPWVIGLIAPKDATEALFEEANRYFIWAALSPIIMLAPFQLDGVFIGATRGRALRNSMVAATAIFAAMVVFLSPALGNHGLWLAFSVFMLARAGFLMMTWNGFKPLFESGETAPTC